MEGPAEQPTKVAKAGVDEHSPHVPQSAGFLTTTAVSVSGGDDERDARHCSSTRNVVLQEDCVPTAPISRSGNVVKCVQAYVLSTLQQQQMVHGDNGTATSQSGATSQSTAAGVIQEPMSDL